MSLHHYRPEKVIRVFHRVLGQEVSLSETENNHANVTQSVSNFKRESGTKYIHKLVQTDD